MTESERNLKGQELEKAGDIEQAILLYEKNVDLGSAAPFPYTRLSLIYAKKKDYDNVIRILRLLLSIKEIEAKKFGWKPGSRQYDKIDEIRVKLTNSMEKKQG